MTEIGSPKQALALSDQMVPYVHSLSVKENFGGVEFIVGCGDLPADYLEFVVSMLDKRLYFVPGNHDPDDYQIPGGRSLDGRYARHGALMLAGAGGSVRYKPDGRHQYTQLQMHLRILKMLPRMALRRLTTGRGVDFFITHAPPFGVHDGPGEAHIGFKAFHLVIAIARPFYLLHGHQHIHRNLERSETVLGDTTVVNVYPQRVIEW